jgi:hypothetical protein
MSAAFDTVDHHILLERLSSIGVAGTAFKWFQSYLTARTSSVMCNGHTSPSSPLECGVPQGSVLGPLLFSIYIGGVSDIIQQHGLQYVLYADDLQILASSPTASVKDTVTTIEKCINEVILWLTVHHLIINKTKTEFILFGSKPNLTKLSDISLTLGGTEVQQSSVVRNLGFHLDFLLSMDDQVNRVSRTAFMYLKVISKQAIHLDSSSTALLINAFVLSRLDYGASLLYGVTKKTLYKLQRVINYAARMLKHMRREESISSALKELKWLPMSSRVFC